MRILTDRGTEYCGKAERLDYQLYLAINDIEHTKTKAQSPQTKEICERFHKTILQEFYQVAFRKNLYANLHSLQADLDEWLMYYQSATYSLGKDVLWPHANNHTGGWKEGLAGAEASLNLT